MVLVYIVGKQLIEPRLRLATIKRVVFLLLCLTPFVLIEFVTSKNPWLRVSAALFGEGYAGWFVQTRGGHARVAACYGQAILAGMIFLVAVALNYYLVQVYKVDKDAARSDDVQAAAVSYSAADVSFIHLPDPARAGLWDAWCCAS